MSSSSDSDDSISMPKYSLSTQVVNEMAESNAFGRGRRAAAAAAAKNKDLDEGDKKKKDLDEGDKKKKKKDKNKKNEELTDDCKFLRAQRGANMLMAKDFSQHGERDLSDEELKLRKAAYLESNMKVQFGEAPPIDMISGVEWRPKKRDGADGATPPAPEAPKRAARQQTPHARPQPASMLSTELLESLPFVVIHNCDKTNLLSEARLSSVFF